MRRTQRTHVPLADARLLVELGSLVEDRSDEEQSALVGLAAKVDRVDGTPDGTIGQLVHQVVDTRLYNDGEPIDRELGVLAW